MENAERIQGHGRQSHRMDSHVATTSFRVRTVDDFDTGAHGRKPRSSAMACQMCRSRKIKCVTTSAQDVTRPYLRSPCTPCSQANLECKWEVVDGRKVRKSRFRSNELSGPRKHVQGVVRPSSTCAPDSNEGLNTAETNFETSSEVPTAASMLKRKPPRFGIPHIDSSQLPPSSDLFSSDIDVDQTGNARFIFENESGNDLNATGYAFVVPQVDSGAEHLLGLLPPPSNQNDSTGVQGSKSPIIGWSNDQMSGTQEWLDLQNFVLGFEYDGAFDVADLDAEHPENETEATQAQPRRLHHPIPRVVRLRYYRRFGPTAVAPGLRRLSVIVEPGENNGATLVDDPPESESATSLGDIASPASAISNQSKIFDKASSLPCPDILPQILDTFFQHFGGHFPFLNPEILGGHVRTGEASSFLLNAIVALTIRFCPLEGPLSHLQGKYEHPWQRGVPFLKKAKEQLIPLLSIPAPEVVAGLLILAWADFGDNNETGLWMFVGMAIRMAQDLDFHRTPDTIVDPLTSFHDHACPSPDGNYILTDKQSLMHQQKARLVMFWSIFIMDVCISPGTGRPPTIRRSEIEVAIPTAADMKVVQLDFSDSFSTGNSVFPETVRLMLHFAEAVEVLNQRVPTLHQGPSTSGSGRQEHLVDIKCTLLRSYNLLPPGLVFSVESYREASLSSQSGLFLLLHLFFYTLMALLTESISKDTKQGLHQDRSLQSSTGNIFRDLTQDSDKREYIREPGFAMIILQKMVQVLTTVDLIDKKGYLATPFVGHCLFMAASMLLQGTQGLRTEQQSSRNEEPIIHEPGNHTCQISQVYQPTGTESQTTKINNQTADRLLFLFAENDYQLLRQKLQSQAEYFAAINSLVSVLDQREKGLADEDLGGMSDTPSRVVDVMDPGIVMRYAIPSEGN